jgi:hypothetical protein
MLCKNILPLLSEFFDEVLDADTTVQVSQHLGQCAQCRKELDNLSTLHGKLKSLRGVAAPGFLGNLIQHRLVKMQQDSWRKNLRNGLERSWSKIRTTEGMWYVSKALGTVMTSLFFVLISSSVIPPSYIAVPPAAVAWDAIPPLVPAYTALKRKIQSDPAISDLCLLAIGESNTRAGKDDTITVVIAVDCSGAAKIQKVLGHINQDLLIKIDEVISSARFRPASEKGKDVPSQIIFTFSKANVTAHV